MQYYNREASLSTLWEESPFRNFCLNTLNYFFLQRSKGNTNLSRMIKHITQEMHKSPLDIEMMNSIIQMLWSYSKPQHSLQVTYAIKTKMIGILESRMHLSEFSLTWALRRNMPELVRTSLSTLLPDSLSVTIDFSNLSFAFPPNANKTRHNVTRVNLTRKLDYWFRNALLILHYKKRKQPQEHMNDEQCS